MCRNCTGTKMEWERVRLRLLQLTVSSEAGLEDKRH